MSKGISGHYSGTAGDNNTTQGKNSGYSYSGTKEDIVATASSLPEHGSTLVSQGWNDISHPKQAEAGSHTYEDPSTGLRIRFDEAKPGEKGYAGKNHYHILNPDATGSKDLYLDKDGNPVAKNSKASHILPKKGKKEK